MSFPDIDSNFGTKFKQIHSSFMKKFWLSLIGLCGLFGTAEAQGTLTGDLQMNYNFYQYDSSIDAITPTLYKHYLNGGEAWLSLRYNYKGFTAFARVDAFQNSNLYNPNTAFTAFGIGAFSLSKEIKGLTITGGYIYDQVGSGILFRSYEDRGLLIDNALVGLHLKYAVSDKVTLKAFGGQQKMVQEGSVSGRFKPLIKGFNAEGDFNIGKKAHILPGVGVLNRTLDEETYSVVSSNIAIQPDSQQFVPRYNTYAFTAYNTLTIGGLSWYVEGAYKTHETIANSEIDLLQDKSGTVFYTTLGYARKGLAVNLTGKRVENFQMRTSPNEVSLTNAGFLNWQPLVQRIRPQRLIARYTPATQDLSELSGNIDVLYSPNEKLDVTLNYAHINNLDGDKLYREIYGDVQYRTDGHWNASGGIQYLEYNILKYQVDLKNPEMIFAVTPFVDVTYRISPKKSIRVEAEYQHTLQDYGSWAYLLTEFTIAPKWSFTLADMYNPKPLDHSKETGLKGQHYPYALIAFSKGPNRFTFAYVKQTAGINCAGGVCRYEPAFSGFKVGCTSSF